MPQSDRPIYIAATVIRAAMKHRIAHRPELVLVDGFAIEPQHSNDAAHCLDRPRRLQSLLRIVPLTLCRDLMRLAGTQQTRKIA